MTKKPTQGMFSFRGIVFTLLSIVLLYWTIHNSGLSWHYLELSPKQLIYFLLAVVVLVATIWVQSIRVKIPWETWKPAKNKLDTFNGLFIGNFYNCVLPGNLGEGVRAWHFKNKNHVPFVAALASIGVEKYIDALNFIMYTLLLALLYSADAQMLTSIFTVTIIVSVIFLFYLVIITQRHVEKRIMGMLFWFFSAGKWLYKLHYHIKGFLRRMTKEQIIRYLFWGYLMFALNALQYYLVMKATHVPDAMINFKSAFLVAIAMVLVCIVPSAPGNIGVIHFGIYAVLVASLREYNITPDQVVLRSLGLYTVYLHFSYFLPEVILGGIVVIKERKWIF